ncbi:MAG: efflux RND transporter permease subunit, partial [Rhodospirillales bacterium]|nr:efflux RND transporter permease subunit [Rhodospirillales bacterium]
MVVSELCIRRPVFATVMSLLLVLVGVVAYQRLTVREYPHIDPPVVNVSTRYTGASAEIIESQVTQVLEDSLAGIEGVDYIKSVNRPERSQITIKFDLDRDPDGATSDVRDRVGRMRARLPDEIDEPIIQKVEADASPVIYIAFSSSAHTALEITDFADRFVKDRLQTLPGVAEVRIFGERRYSMRLWLDPFRLAAYRMTPQDVEDALRRQNIEVPAGRIESTNREFTVLSETDLRTEEEFNNLIIRDEKGYLIRLQDVGHAVIAAEDERRVARFKGRPAVAMGVVKQATANPLDVVNGVRAELPNIEAELPDGMRMETAYDKTIYIRESIKNVYVTIGEAVLLVVLIIFVFLRSLRATIIPLVTIPVSLVGAFALMFAFDFSINTLTLLAMVLAIGLVVDDAIVMLENVYRHVEEGMPRYQAALLGSKEIGFAIVTMTITLAAVYAPVGFMTGTTGRLFNEFAWTLAGTVLVSGFVALTLTPMMCSKLLVHKTKHGVLYNVIEAGLRGNANLYKTTLAWALGARLLVLAVGAGVAALGVVLFLNLKSELAPVEDQGSIRGIFIAPEGSTIDYTQRYSEEIERLLDVIPEVDRYFVVSGFPTVSQGIAFIRLHPWDERDREQHEITTELAPKMFDITGLLAFPMNPPPLGQSTR